MCVEIRKNRIFVRARRKSSVPLEGPTSSDFSELPLMDADTTDSFNMYVNNTSSMSEGGYPQSDCVRSECA